MSTITATYCAFCDLVANAFNGIITFFERVGRARAAAELSRQGYVEQAKALMLEQD
jgi:hypothetical protein